MARKRRRSKQAGSPQQPSNKKPNNNDNSTNEIRESEIQNVVDMSTHNTPHSHSVCNSVHSSSDTTPIYSPDYMPTYTVIGTQQQPVNQTNTPNTEQIYVNSTINNSTPNRRNATSYTNPTYHTTTSAPNWQAAPTPPSVNNQNCRVYQTMSTGNSQPHTQSSPGCRNNIMENKNTAEPAWLNRLYAKIDNIGGRITFIESELQSFRTLNENVSKVEQTLKQVSHDFNSIRAELETHYQEVNELKDNQVQQRDDIDSIKQQMLYDQCRSMRNNLLIYGIKEYDNEDPEKVVRGFLEETMQVNTSSIELDRCHRIGPRRRDKIRPLVIRFLRYKDKEYIRKLAPEKLRGSPYGISEQFPKEIADRRRLLVPIMKKEKSDKKKATLVVDKLFTEEAIYSVRNGEVQRSDKQQKRNFQTYERRHSIKQGQSSRHQFSKHTSGRFGNQNVNFQYNPNLQKTQEEQSHQRPPVNLAYTSGRQAVDLITDETNFDPLYNTSNNQTELKTTWRPVNESLHMDTGGNTNNNAINNAIEQPLISWEPIQADAPTHRTNTLLDDDFIGNNPQSTNA